MSVAMDKRAIKSSTLNDFYLKDSEWLDNACAQQRSISYLATDLYSMEHLFHWNVVFAGC